MSDVRRAAAELVDERPAAEDALREALECDDGFTFDDVHCDSGVFGEIVSRGIIESVDGGYRVADRAGVRAALGEEAAEPEGEAGGFRPSEWYRDGRGWFGRLATPEALALVGALALVVVIRVPMIGRVYRQGEIVLPGNDPYYYRYWVETIAKRTAGPFDFSILGSLPVAKGEPLMVSTLWWWTEVFGGTTTAAGHVLAWYPVFSAVITGLLVYWLAVRLFRDRRVGVAAVALFATVPAHAFRTSLGFADHHAFDYPWLALTALALMVVVDRNLRDWRTMCWTLVLGLGIAGQTLAWEAGPLFLIPLGLYAILLVPSWVRVDRSPIMAALPLVAGITVGAVLSGGAHLVFNWHTTMTSYSPLLLLSGVVGVVVFGEAARRVEISPRSVLGTEVGLAFMSVLVLPSAFPRFALAFDRGVEFLLHKEGVVETFSLFSGHLGTIIGPIFVFGLVLFLALPYMAWSVWRCSRDHSPRWLAVTVYAWYFFVLSILQIRFAGHLAIFVAVFSGLGFVHVASWVDLVREPEFLTIGETSGSATPESPSIQDEPEMPSRREAMYTAGIGLGIGSLGALMTPIQLSQVAINNGMYETAQFMRKYSQKRGLDYPENYVFSQWGRNRAYNWFVNGQARSYNFAQEHFSEFIQSPDGENWYHRLRDQNRDGFIVVSQDQTVDPGDNSLYEKLVDQWGERTGHYQAIWANDSNTYKVYKPVPGVTLTGPGDPGDSFSISNTATVSGQQIHLERSVSINEFGVYAVTLPYPGRYELIDQPVTVNEHDVQSGTIIDQFNGPGRHYWSFDEGHGERLYDYWGGHHGDAVGTDWSTEGDRTGLRFNGNDVVTIPKIRFGPTEPWTVSIRLTPHTERNWQVFLSNGSSAGPYLMFHRQNRLFFRDENNEYSSVPLVEPYQDRRLHLVITRTDTNHIRVYENGELRGQISPTSTTVKLRSIGRADPRQFSGTIYDLRIYGQNLAESPIEL